MVVVSKGGNGGIGVNRR